MNKIKKKKISLEQWLNVPITLEVLDKNEIL